MNPHTLTHSKLELISHLPLIHTVVCETETANFLNSNKEKTPFRFVVEKGNTNDNKANDIKRTRVYKFKLVFPQYTHVRTLFLDSLNHLYRFLGKTRTDDLLWQHTLK